MDQKSIVSTIIPPTTVDERSTVSNPIPPVVTDEKSVSQDNTEIKVKSSPTISGTKQLKSEVGEFIRLMRSVNRRIKLQEEDMKKEMERKRLHDVQVKFEQECIPSLLRTNPPYFLTFTIQTSKNGDYLKINDVFPNATPLRNALRVIGCEDSYYRWDTMTMIHKNPSDIRIQWLMKKLAR